MVFNVLVSEKKILLYFCNFNCNYNFVIYDKFFNQSQNLITICYDRYQRISVSYQE